MRQKSATRLILEPLMAAVVLAAVVRVAVRLYSIPSASMEPTLLIGDHIVVTPYWHAAPQRGDVIVFRSPSSPREWVVKRVVAVPGDLVDSRSGSVRIGGYTTPEPYLSQRASTGQISPQLVPADRYYVLGDNRAVSYDSRSWGAIPRDLIVGRARLILWSSGRSNVRAASALGVGGRLRIFKWIE